MANRCEKMETVTDFVFLGSKITVNGDCSHEIKRCLLLLRIAMADLDSVFKSRDITLLTKVHLVNAMVFPVVMYGYESWAIKMAECRRVDAFELWHRRHRRCRFNPLVGKIPSRKNVHPFQHSCLGNPMDRGAWWATVHGTDCLTLWLAKNQTQLSTHTSQVLSKGHISFYSTLWWNKKVRAQWFKNKK